MSGYTLFATIFGFIFLAELPDKTALASLVLATRHRPLPVFLGAALALAIQSVVAVAAGRLFSLLPTPAVHVGAAILFLVSAIVMWRRRPDKESESENEGPESVRRGFFRAFWIVFTVVFIAEWGDLTQIATAGFEARHQSPLLVFAAATSALWSVAALAVLVGNRAGRLLDPRVTQRVAAILFGLVGIALLDAVVLACAFDEDRLLVTSNVDDFVKLGRAVQIHPGLVLFEDGGLLREEQLRLVREALVLVQGELASGRDMVNRALRIWVDSTHVFDSIP